MPGGYHRICCCPTVPEWPPLVLPDPVCAPPAACPTTTLILEPGACDAPVTQLTLPRFLWWGFPAEARGAAYSPGLDKTVIFRWYRKVHPDEAWRIGPSGLAWFATECYYTPYSPNCLDWNAGHEAFDLVPIEACGRIVLQIGTCKVLLPGLATWSQAGWPEIALKIVYETHLWSLRHTEWNQRVCDDQVVYWSQFRAYEYNASPPAYDVQFPDEATFDTASFTWAPTLDPHWTPNIGYILKDKSQLFDAYADKVFNGAGRVCAGLATDPRLGFHYDPDTGAPMGHRPDWDALSAWDISHDDPTYGLCVWSYPSFKPPGILYVRISEELEGDHR